MRHARLLRRGYMDVEPWMGVSCYPVGPAMVGGVPTIRPGYDHFRLMRPQAPLRAIGMDTPLPPVLFNRMDQIILIENALALQRTENQISVTLSQLALGIRNADNFLENHLLHKEVRPSIHTLWFHDGGLREHPYVLAGLAAHHLVPLFSLVSYDVERGKMSVFEAEELYEELMDCSVAQPKIVQRELANQMIRVYCLSDDYDKAIRVVEEMRAKRIRRTFVSYAPLFRMIRAKQDVEQQMRLLEYMYATEGGRLPKFLFIDVPRMFYMFGVFLRYNWVAINVVFTVVVTSLLLNYVNYATW
ncbi:PPR repeat [Novymonas esmeraldas]|uniref:PPR repeat n=1 Tax=Novymonas esmeraldas TaxID=1808958 RepID=A0AAW0F3M4_9TRYP